MSPLLSRGNFNFGFGKKRGGRRIPFSATGGTEITSGSSKYHVFTTTGSPQPFVASGAPQIVEILVVGGGGQGGLDGGGGGAGGVAYNPSFSLSAGSYIVVVGSGGNGASTPQSPSREGNPSTITLGVDVITANGGGAGQVTNNPSGRKNGGSGGGRLNADPAGTATQPTQPQPSGTLNYGNPGVDAMSGGGGGGAGGVGGPAGGAGNEPPFFGSPGGPGQPFPSFPAPVIAPAIPAPVRPDWISAVGPTGLFGGGGGAKAAAPGWPGGNPGPGGGGRGEGPNPNTHTSGITNTGGGGGGGGFDFPTSGRPGGPGIVIVRYPV